MRRLWLLLAVFACACSKAPEQRPSPPSARAAAKAPSPFDDNFWKHWGDGNVEVCRYNAGTGTATMYTHLDARRILKMTLLKQTGDRAEMLDLRVTLDGVDKTPPGGVLSVVISRHSPSGPAWEQAVFGPGRAFVTMHRPGRPDGHRVLSYSATPFPMEAGFLWARRIAWPRIGVDSSRRTDAILSLERQESVMLNRGKLTATGGGWTWEVHPALPHHIKSWSSSTGERAQLISCERLPASSLHFVVDGPEFGGVQTPAAQ